MRPLRVRIRNVRGARDVDLHLRPFSALIGPNNAGKSTLLDAIRLFYGALTWDERRDRPWDVTDDQPSWVEVGYELSTADFKEIRLDPLEDDLLTVRRYLTDDGEQREGHYYLVPAQGDSLEPTGWREVAGRLGQCVYIPAATRVQDQTSLTGPSPLREVMMLALSEPRVDGALGAISHSLQGLRQAMEAGPVRHLEEALATALNPWGLAAQVRVGELTEEFLLQNLINLTLSHGGVQHPMETEGSGVQRVLIAGLIQAAAQLRRGGGRDAFRWVLFEEPEVYLHPAQVGRLAQDLGRIAAGGNAAVTITTHDPTMLSASRISPEGIARIHRYGPRIRVTSHAPEAVTAVLDDVRLRSAYTRAAHSCFTKPPATPPGDEHDRVLYDLDPRRAAAFFADKVIVVEGFSDAVFFEWLDRHGHLTRLGPNVGVLDAGGKYELHRAVATLSLFQIPHVLVWDEDAAMQPPGTNEHRQQECRDRASLEAIRAAASHPQPTIGGVRLDGTIERWLGIPEEKVNAWKAVNLATALDEAYADPQSPVPGRVDALLGLIGDLFENRDLDKHRARTEFASCLIERGFTKTTVDIPTVVRGLPCAACTCRPSR